MPMSSILVQGQLAKWELTTLLAASLLELCTAATASPGHQKSPSTIHCGAYMTNVECLCPARQAENSKRSTPFERRFRRRKPERQLQDEFSFLSHPHACVQVFSEEGGPSDAKQQHCLGEPNVATALVPSKKPRPPNILICALAC